MKLALVAIAAEWDRQYLDEWIRWHKSIGIDDVYIITNNWEWTPSGKGVYTGRIDGKVKQLPAYNSWLGMFGKKTAYDWVFFLDIDEFIWPGDCGLKERMARYDWAEAVGFNWRLFGDSGLTEPGVTCLDRFTKCQRGLNKHVKIALKLPTEAYMNSPHTAATDNGFVKTSSVKGQMFTGPFCSSLEYEDGMPFIAHFFCKTKKEYLYRRSFGRADCDQVRPESDFDLHNFNDEEFTGFKEKVK